MTRIICTGNRCSPEDAAGLEVHDLLRRGSLPEGVELIDGGLGGLDLLRCLEGADRVVFVDRVSGFGEPGEVLEVDAGEVAALASPRCDHAAGVPYLLRVLPAVCEGKAPAIRIVGIEERAGEAAIARAAELALALAAGEAR